jgi:hypothetical protein
MFAVRGAVEPSSWTVDRIVHHSSVPSSCVFLTLAPLAEPPSVGDCVAVDASNGPRTARVAVWQAPVAVLVWTDACSFVGALERVQRVQRPQPWPHVLLDQDLSLGHFQDYCGVLVHGVRGVARGVRAHGATLEWNGGAFAMTAVDRTGDDDQATVLDIVFDNAILVDPRAPVDLRVRDFGSKHIINLTDTSIAASPTHPTVVWPNGVDWGSSVGPVASVSLAHAGFVTVWTDRAVTNVSFCTTATDVGSRQTAGDRATEWTSLQRVGPGSVRVVFEGATMRWRSRVGSADVVFCVNCGGFAACIDTRGPT